MTGSPVRASPRESARSQCAGRSASRFHSDERSALPSWNEQPRKLRYCRSSSRLWLRCRYRRGSRESSPATAPQLTECKLVGTSTTYWSFRTDPSATSSATFAAMGRRPPRWDLRYVPVGRPSRITLRAIRTCWARSLDISFFGHGRRRDEYVTVNTGRIDPTGTNLVYVSAGHPWPVLRRCEHADARPHSKPTVGNPTRRTLRVLTRDAFEELHTAPVHRRPVRRPIGPWLRAAKRPRCRRLSPSMRSPFGSRHAARALHDTRKPRRRRSPRDHDHRARSDLAAVAARLGTRQLSRAIVERLPGGRRSLATARPAGQLGDPSVFVVVRRTGLTRRASDDVGQRCRCQWSQRRHGQDGLVGCDAGCMGALRLPRARRGLSPAVLPTSSPLTACSPAANDIEYATIGGVLHRERHPARLLEQLHAMTARNDGSETSLMRPTQTFLRSHLNA